MLYHLFITLSPTPLYWETNFFHTFLRFLLPESDDTGFALTTTHSNNMFRFFYIDRKALYGQKLATKAMDSFKENKAIKFLNKWNIHSDSSNCSFSRSNVSNSSIHC